MSGKGVVASSSSSSVPVKVSIPNGLKKTIHNIKEAVGHNHTDHEIYAMLKDSSMDPNETTHKLLLLDTFQEVKRRDKKKENLNEAAESKLKPSIQVRPNRAGRGNYPPRNISHNSGRNLVVARENVTRPFQDKGTKNPPLASAQEIKKVGPSSSSAALPNYSRSSSNSSLSSNNIQDNHANPVVFPSQDLPLPSAVDPSQHEVESDHAFVKVIADSPTEIKFASVKNSSFEVESSNLPLSSGNNFHGVGKNQHLDFPLSESSTTGASIVISRPSSSHDNRSRVIGPHKVGPVQEWKPRANSIVNDGISTVTSSESVKSHPESQDILELQRKLEESHIASSEHVIIPNHLHVPQAEKLGFCFGSFDVASFGELSFNNVPASDKSHLLSQSSVTEANNEPVEEQQLSHINALAPVVDTETTYPGQSEIQSPVQEPEIYLSNEVEISSSVTPEYDESKQEVAPETIQHPVVHTSSNFNNGLIPLTPNTQRTPLESSEWQARNAPRFPGYIVPPQYFDPASYYAQIYRSGMDTDGRVSSFLSTGATASKYSENGVVVSQQPIQSPQELQGGVPLVLSTSAPTPVATQQPLPIFRQPSGVHLPHFPPNYIPYGPYLSPYYMPPPTIHQFLSNGAFPLQPQSGNVYPTFAGTNASKYPVSQYKQGSNMENSTHIGGPPGSYAQSMANYAASNSAAITSTSNDDIAAPQVKENNTYVSGQQIEGSGLWFSTTPNRDISTLLPTFYNLPQGQLAFNPTQPGHGTFTGVFHHPAQGAAAPIHTFFQQSQAITSPADIAGPMASVYQQQQHAQQMNWPSNY